MTTLLKTRLPAFALSLCLHGMLAGVPAFFAPPAVPAPKTRYQIFLVEASRSPSPASLLFAEPLPAALSEGNTTAAAERRGLSSDDGRERMPIPREASFHEGLASSPRDGGAASVSRAVSRPSASSSPALAPPAEFSSFVAGAPADARHVARDTTMYEEDQVDQRPSVAVEVRPEYPLRARRAGVEGRVVVRLVVDASGMPGECVVHTASPAGYFEEAALAAACKTRFTPGIMNGRTVKTLVRLPFVFSLR